MNDTWCLLTFFRRTSNEYYCAYWGSGLTLLRLGSAVNIMGGFSVIQRDSESSHMAEMKQQLVTNNLHDNITPNICPLDFPDLNPLDCCFWSMVEKNVNEHVHSTKMFRKALMQHLIWDYKIFWSHRDTIIDACADFIE